MQDLKKMIRALQQGKYTRDNLERYRREALRVYPERAALELTFSAYTLREEMNEEKSDLAGREREMVDSVMGALKELCDLSFDREKMLCSLKKLRHEITDRMDYFTAYTDRLVCYEYVLNRKELKFMPEEKRQQYLSLDEEKFMRDILWYIFGSEDQSTMKAKLRVVLSQISPRMTKSTLFEKISEALNLYRGEDRSALDDYLYVLRTSAMIYEPAGAGRDYPDLEKSLERLEGADYENMTESEYMAMDELLNVVSKAIHEITDFYCGLQHVVNEIYALCLLSAYPWEKSALFEKCRNVWCSILADDYVDEMLVELEGEIEKRVDAAMYLESVLYEIRSADQIDRDPDMKDFITDLGHVAELLSDSLFMDLDRESDQTVADDACVDQRTEEFLAELSEKLKNLSRPLRKAVSSQILEKMPIFLRNQDETEEYIRVNLLGCQDKAEKYMVMSMLLNLVRKEQEWRRV